MSKTWGYILEGPGRPDLAKQKAALLALGVDMGPLGLCWHDKITRGSTRPRSQLVAREDLLRAVMAGDTVVFADPLCIAVGPKDAAWCLGELSDRGAAVIVNGDLERIEPRADTAPMVDRVSKAMNVHHVRVAKKRAAKSK